MKDYKWNRVFKPLIQKYQPKTFCEIGKKTAKQRIDVAKSAWEGR